MSVAVEIKRRGEIDGVAQLTRYLELLDGDPLLAPVRGVFAAQEIKPGLDGHLNGAQQIAVRARAADFEVVYSGIRLTVAQIVAAAIEEDVNVVGLSILSGSHLSVVPEVLDGLRAAGVHEGLRSQTCCRRSSTRSRRRAPDAALPLILVEPSGYS